MSPVASFTDGIAHERNQPGLPTAWAIVALSSLRSGANIPPCPAERASTH